MLTIPSQARLFLCLAPTDMRKSIDGLCGLASGVLEQDPLSGHLFVFVGRRRDRVKILYWDTTGYAVWYKRLERGCFELPRVEPGQTSVALSATDLAMLLDGVELSSVKRRPRYRREAAAV